MTTLLPFSLRADCDRGGLYAELFSMQAAGWRQLPATATASRQVATQGVALDTGEHEPECGVAAAPIGAQPDAALSRVDCVLGCLRASLVEHGWLTKC